MELEVLLERYGKVDSKIQYYEMAKDMRERELADLIEEVKNYEKNLGVARKQKMELLMAIGSAAYVE